MTDEELQGIRDQLRAAEGLVRHLRAIVTREDNARAVVNCPFAIGDEVAIAAYGKATVFCVTEIKAGSSKSARVFGRQVRKDGSLGTLVRELWDATSRGVKVGHRDLPEEGESSQ